MPENRPPVTDPLAAKVGTQTKAAEPRAPLREFKPRAEPKFDAQADAWPEPKFDPKPESKSETKPEPKFETKPEPKLDSPPTPGKNLYDNLEQEMASLLGRPSGKT
jgi:flagellar protein FliO/FliZ